MTIAVTTPTIPGRGDFLVEACRSVNEQTRQPDAHLIGYDFNEQGGAMTRNRLCFDSSAEWIAPLDDDDLLLPNHLALLEKASAEADVVYSRCEVRGRLDWEPSGPFDPDRMRRGNYIPVTTLIRRSLLLELGGWRRRQSCPNGYVDWDFWLRALDLGARFIYVPEVTWVYRFHRQSQSLIWAERAFHDEHTLEDS